MKKFDPQACRSLRDDMEKALDAVAKKHGITIAIGKMSYTENNISVKIELATVGESGLANNREAEDFKRYASMYELAPTDFGREFSVRGDRYQIVGLNTRKQKFPIKCKRASDGKVYGLHAEDVKRALSLQGVAS